MILIPNTTCYIFVQFYKKLGSGLSDFYELTDSANKFYSILFELRKSGQSRKLKIEIRKNNNNFDL